MQKPFPQFAIPIIIATYRTPIAPKDFPTRNIGEEFKVLHEVTSDEQYASKLIKDERFKALNRYIDILPYEHTVVKLDDKELSPSNYINGSFLHNPLFGDAKPSFILTQGPLEHTVEHFWSMIDKQNVREVLCIVESHSLGSRCAKYWPSKKLKLEEYEVDVLSTAKNALYEKKEISLSNNKLKTCKQVQHYHVYNWLDFSTLTGEDINGLLTLIARLYEEQQKQASPIVVHCSAGVGRSGTFTAVYFAYEYWRHCKDTGIEFKVSVFDLVLHMRQMRLGLVQTVQQYKFIYALVAMFK